MRTEPPRPPEDASNYSRAIAEATDSHDVSPGRAVEMIDNDGAQLVDVRQDFEWEAGRISGAEHIPMEQLPGATDRLDPERPIVFQCRSGARSAMAASVFREAGFDAHNLAGGIAAWVEEGREIEPEGGTVAAPRPDNS